MHFQDVSCFMAYYSIHGICRFNDCCHFNMFVCDLCLYIQETLPWYTAACIGWFWGTSWTVMKSTCPGISWYAPFLCAIICLWYNADQLFVNLRWLCQTKQDAKTAALAGSCSLYRFQLSLFFQLCCQFLQTAAICETTDIASSLCTCIDTAEAPMTANQTAKKCCDCCQQLARSVPPAGFAKAIQNKNMLCTSHLPTVATLQQALHTNAGSYCSTATQGAR